MSSVATITWNALAHRYFVSRNSAPGIIYDVGGYGIHLYCTGQGSPTVVLEAGLASGALSWNPIQPALSLTTRVCSYDRAGLGWSAPRTETRDANRVADELHALLQQAGIAGPTILVGHSLGGIYIRAYASRYPQDVDGLIFVDSAPPLYEEHGSTAMKALRAKDNSSTSSHYMAKAIFVLGLPRLAGECSKVPTGFGKKLGQMRSEDLCDPNLTAIWEEMRGIRASGYETVHTGPYRDTPVLIFSQDTRKTASSEAPPELADEWATDWDQMQEDLKKLSSRSRRIIATDSTHFVQVDRSELVISELSAFIEEIRTGMAPPAPYGSTIRK